MNNNDTNDTNTNKSNYKKIFKRETKVIALVVICLALAALGTSYAVFLQTNNNKENQVVKAGSLEIRYEEQKENKADLNLDSDDDDKNCLAPKTDEEGKTSGCLISFSIANQGSLPAHYDLLIYNNPVVTEGKEPVGLENFKFSLTKRSTPKGGEAGDNEVVGDAGEESKVLSALPTYTPTEGDKAPEESKEYNNASILEESNIEVGEKIEFSLRVWLKDDATKDLINKTVDLKLGVIDIVYEKDAAAETILASMGQEKGIHEIMPTPSDPTGIGMEQETSKIREFRYSGPDPNNYVYFNCPDTSENNEGCEKWRILAVTEEDKDGNQERTVKLVKTDVTTTFYQPTGELDQLTTVFNGLTTIAKNQIVETDYKIGTISDLNITGFQVLALEQNGTSVKSKVGILSISDYMLASSNWESAIASNFTASKDNSYLVNTDNERLLDKNESNGYYMISGTDHIFTTISDAEQSYNEHIVVTLNKDVKIISGTGTQEDPYVLSK